MTLVTGFYGLVGPHITFLKETPFKNSIMVLLTEVFKGLLGGGLHHNIIRSVAKNSKLSAESCTVSRVPLTRGGPRLVRSKMSLWIKDVLVARLRKRK